MVCEARGRPRRNSGHGTLTMVMTQRMTVERQVVISPDPSALAVARLEPGMGRPDKADFLRNMGAWKTAAEFERVVQAAAGPSGLIEMARFDPGDVLRKETGNNAPKAIRLLIGNPLVMKQ